MFLKNDMRPAMATASPSSVGKATHTTRNESATYSNATSEAEEFNAFHPGAGRNDMGRNRPRRPEAKRPATPILNPKLLIAIAVAALAVLLVVIIVAFAVTKDNSIHFEDNAYIAYADSDGNYHVAVNGSVIDEEFEGEVTVTPAADNSFAYVTDESAEGVQVYILKGKKLEPVTLKPVSEVLAYAELKPGLVYLENDKYYIFSEDIGDEAITKDINADNFVISPDASTVAYTRPDNDNAGETQMYIYRNGSDDKVNKNCTPVALSNHGDYLYASALDKELVNNLYVIDTEEFEKVLIENSDSFLTIIDMNIKGDEIMFCTGDATNVETCIYLAKKNVTHTLSKSLLYPAASDATIAIYDSFANIYVNEINISLEEGVNTPTYHLNKKYELNKISSYSGKFDTEGEYFYYINKDATLRQVDLTDKDFPTADIYEDVTDFAITEKGNVYFLTEDEILRFYKLSTGKKDKISTDAVALSLYNYSNNVYFSEDNNGEISIFVSEEGSKSTAAKFDSIQLTNVPYFSNATSKKTYAYYYDVDDGWMLYYTSNGKSFKVIERECGAINGVEIPE